MFLITVKALLFLTEIEKSTVFTVNRFILYENLNAELWMSLKSHQQSPAFVTLGWLRTFYILNFSRTL